MLSRCLSQFILNGHVNSERWNVQQIFSSDGSKPNAVDFAEFDGEGKTDVAESYNGDCWGLAFLPKASGEARAGKLMLADRGGTRVMSLVNAAHAIGRAVPVHWQVASGAMHECQAPFGRAAGVINNEDGTGLRSFCHDQLAEPVLAPRCQRGRCHG
jgi:hypothetical protein